jgi:hypothetical protein
VYGGRQGRDDPPSDTGETDVECRSRDLSDDHVRGDLETDVSDKEDGHDRIVLVGGEGEVVHDPGEFGRGDVLGAEEARIVSLDGYMERVCETHLTVEVVEDVWKRTVKDHC